MKRMLARRTCFVMRRIRHNNKLRVCSIGVPLDRRDSDQLIKRKFMQVFVYAPRRGPIKAMFHDPQSVTNIGLLCSLGVSHPVELPTEEVAFRRALVPGPQLLRRNNLPPRQRVKLLAAGITPD
jgi:hypothetical protein